MANPIIDKINAEMDNLQKELFKFKSTVDYLNSAKENVGNAVQILNVADDHFQKKVKELQNTYNSFIQLSETIAALLKKINTINFPERLDKIENSVKETISQLEEIKDETISKIKEASDAILHVDFEKKFSKLQDAIDTSVRENNDFALSIKSMKIPESLKFFQDDMEALLKTTLFQLGETNEKIARDVEHAIISLNLPLRMDKLDANIAGIMAAVQNIQSRIDSVEKNINDKIKDSGEKQSNALTSFQENFLKQLEVNDQKNIVNFNKQQTYTKITWALIIVTLIICVILHFVK